jgi:hypothetical protein
MIALHLALMMCAPSAWAADVERRLDSWPTVELAGPEDGRPLAPRLRPLGSTRGRGASAARSRLSFDLPSDGLDPISLESDGVAVSVRIMDATVGPWRRASSALVARSLGGDTLLLRGGRGRVEDYRVIEAQRPGPLARYQLDLGPGAHVRSLDDVVEIVDRTGAPRLRMARPYVLDARGERLAAHTEISGCEVDRDPRAPWGRAPREPGSSTCQLTVELSPDAAPVFPILLDPLWTGTSDLTEPRVSRGVALGQTGLVLFAGGRNDAGYLASAELYDEATDTFAVTASLDAPRAGLALTWVSGPELALVTGGCVGAAVDCVVAASARLYDPSRGSWREVQPLAGPRAAHVAHQLGDGRVLVVGGLTAADPGTPALATSEWFDPTSEAFSEGPPMSTGIYAFGSSVLSGGGLAVAGGRSSVGGADLKRVMRFDSEAQAWVALPDLPFERRDPFVLELDDGRLAVFGGTFLVTPLQASVVLEASGTWTSTGSLATGHPGGMAMALPNGWLAVAGGADLTSVEVMRADPSAVDAAWSAVDPLAGPRAMAASVRLPSGRWLLAGGWEEGNQSALASAVLFGPEPIGVACTTGGACASGHCIDGVCCDTACDGACSACSIASGAETEGECGAVAAGSPEPTLCAVDEAGCGATGLCGVDGACALRDEGASCGCDDDTTGSCDGEGTCTCAGSVCLDDMTERDEHGELLDCEPYRCAGGECLAQCQRSDDCVPGAVCDRERRCVVLDDVPPAVAACACSTPQDAPRGASCAALALALGLAASRRFTRTSARA